MAPAQINLFSYCQVQILEMPSKTSVCTLKPEADAKPGMPMCLELWQVRPSARQPRPASHAFRAVNHTPFRIWFIGKRKDS